ncbi:flagellar basal-body MS-ring/collar protein FliF [Candidatus Symbiobacter mobilis]|uniref:Flagellar M-ring protein n=1 Tax=Candidatus Symbiobacter mobilis CR TaxID=946483 RepID=U5NDU2_9BURK|nr:flagellar basal-body MS-ring/collar protein FliF [Candidatus Symbiobacter mobilis]AGX88373.1 flagellar M-ring protein FliF [Candidatus Symbiobacter mobilis CR]
MNDAVALPTTATTTATANFVQRLANLDRPQRIRLAVGIVLFAVIVVIGMIMGRQTEWRVLYSNVSDKDGGAIVAQLAQMNVPYQYGVGGGSVLVPEDKVYDTRLKLASMGLPRGTVTGFELMDNANRFGMTQFQERLAFQRGLEGELIRSIQALSSVESARVHLALPNQNGFFREQQKPSASVLVTLHPGRNLDRSQLAGIIHLVASSVPEMDPKAVSVLDDTGKLLSASPEDEFGAPQDAQRLQHIRKIEQEYTRRIMDILEPVVGRKNVRAQVTAEMDFSLSESTSEAYRPNQTPESSAVRSQQTLESNVNPPTPPTGIPGAATNQPPGQMTTDINGPAQAMAAAGTASGALGHGGRRESITNFEVDKTVRVVRSGAGVIKRITAAVVVNHQTVTDAKGKVSQAPISDAQLEKMTALVRETVGYSQERGDSVNIMNAPFTEIAADEEELPWWKRPEIIDMIKSMAWPLGTFLLAALVLFGAIRPALKAMAPAPVVEPSEATAVHVDAIEGEEPERPMLEGPSSGQVPGLPAPPSPEELALEEARKLTRENPAAVANIIKTWINGEAPA